MWLKIKSWFYGFRSILKSVAKTAVGEAVEMILPTVTAVVSDLEKETELSGSQKLERVSSVIKRDYGHISEDIINVVINLAVNIALALIRGR